MEYIVTNGLYHLRTQTNGYNPFEEYGLPYSSMVINSDEFFQDMFSVQGHALRPCSPGLSPMKCKYMMGLHQYLVEIERVENIWEGEGGKKELETDLVIRVEQPDGALKEFSYPLTPSYRKEWSFLIVQKREVFIPSEVELRRNKKSRGRDYCYASFI